MPAFVFGAPVGRHLWHGAAPPSLAGRPARFTTVPVATRRRGARVGLAKRPPPSAPVAMRAADGGGGPPPPTADEVVVAGPFDGAYGSWNLTAADVRGVQTYRLALLACAAATAVGVAGGLAGVDPHALDAAAAVATASLGVAFWTIHVYLKPAHNFLKGLWVVGTVGGAVLGAATWADGGLLAATTATPALLLGWGWLFVGATGLFFKEALCFGRPEAVGLAVGLPLLTGGHFLSGVVGGGAAGLGATLPDWEAPAAVAWVALFVFFAARKVWGQEVVADLGDKSVFAMLDERAAAAAREQGK